MHAVTTPSLTPIKLQCAMYENQETWQRGQQNKTRVGLTPVLLSSGGCCSCSYKCTRKTCASGCYAHHTHGAQQCVPQKNKHTHTRTHRRQTNIRCVVCGCGGGGGCGCGSGGGGGDRFARRGARHSVPSSATPLTRDGTGRSGSTVGPAHMFSSHAKYGTGTWCCG